MRVLLVGNYRPDHQWSMLGYEESLAQYLPDGDVQIEVTRPPAMVGAAPGPLRKWRSYVDKFAIFPRRLRAMKRNYDLVHILDQGNGMYVPHVKDVPHLVTCHDLLAIRAARGEISGWPMSKQNSFFQSRIQTGLAEAKNVASVSLASEDDFKRLIGAEGKRFFHVPNGLLRPFKPLGREAALAHLSGLLPNPEQPFLLHVGGNQWYKNRIGLVRIMEALHRRSPQRYPRLVLAGHAMSEPIREAARKGLAEGYLVEAVRPSHEQIEALYSVADALLFPSLLEGFGLPILEAQSCGCPVFASNRSPMTEAGGDGAAYFDPEDPEAAAASIDAAWEGRGERVAKGEALVADRTPQNLARHYRDVYRQVLA